MIKEKPLSKITTTFKKDGAVFPIRILSEEKTQRYRDEFEKIEAAFNEPVPYMRNLHRYLPWAYDLVTHPKIIELLTPILGEVSVLGSQILTKYPNTDTFVPWHQDAMKNEWNDSLTVWLAFSRSCVENGCMQVVPGSHVNLKHKHVPSSSKDNLIGIYNLEIDREIHESETLNLELAPGEASIHHQNIIHGSQANGSDFKRIGFAIRYLHPKYAKDMKVIYINPEKRYPTATHIERPEPFLNEKDPALYKKFLETRIFSH